MQNVLISPLAIEEGLLQLYIGAEGNTAEQLKHFLQLDGSTKREVLDWYHTWRQRLEKPPANELSIASRLFAAKEIGILPEYETELKRIFDVTVGSVNADDSVKTATIVNNWITRQTHNHIDSLLYGTEDVGLMAVVGVVYFKGFWANCFDKFSNSQRNFYTLSNAGGYENAKVETMQVVGKFKVAEHPEIDASSIQIPYNSSSISMTIYVPNAINGLDRIIAKLEEWPNHEIAAKVQPTLLKLYLPKFKLETTMDMLPALKSLGVRELAKHPNFSSMTRFGKPKIEKFWHKSKLEVDEVGVQAANARASPYNKDKSPEEFTVDRPFIFFIQDDERVYFAGRVGDPRSAYQKNANAEFTI
ncbi:serpin B4-like [Drosophila busckii]|uniref:serpin B4-like n=1 Tax=Drosophila busckii TaxID=30019 RepID=UPI00083F3520|nr:serpin B4-like [Drosophila busckii]